MNSIRAATSASRTALTASARTAAPRRAFSQSQTKRSGHGPSYDPPSGWLFGVKPGEQYEKEGWENAMYWGFGGAIQTWALEEARRRLEAEGILADPDTVKKE
ncbi:uncharacterized protein J4E88_005366 [Alternaria novae-zelandiae]|uniref:uncharacterized protein n=1 Tax=Alternaria novae-zelandiae TaxID=430562 RepID=UPI0020C4B948|nr:uncharacterized protein J4E88_005366 [Alternaria novae-zelandiae]KAI4682476.1 hypothetical protein J4E88_005366 [Alternaria novae-zelandiae]